MLTSSTLLYLCEYILTLNNNSAFAYKFLTSKDTHYWEYKWCMWFIYIFLFYILFVSFIFFIPSFVLFIFFPSTCTFPSILSHSGCNWCHYSCTQRKRSLFLLLTLFFSAFVFFVSSAETSTDTAESEHSSERLADICEWASSCVRTDTGDSVWEHLHSLSSSSASSAHRMNRTNTDVALSHILFICAK